MAVPQEVSGTRYLVIAASLMIVVAGLKAAAAVFVPFLLAFFLAIICFPFLFWLRRHRVPSSFAILLTVLAVVGVITVIGLVLSGSVQRFTAAAPRYQERGQELLAPLVEKLQTYGWEVSDLIQPELFDLGGVINLVRSTFLGVFSAVGVIVLILLILIFILLESVGFRSKIVRALGTHSKVFQWFTKITREVQRYLVIKTGISLATGLAVGLWVWLLGVDFAVFWGFLAFLLNYIPTIGSVVAGIPATVVALIQMGPAAAILTALGYMTVNLVLGNLVEPNLMGQRLRLSPLVVLLSLLFWGWIWGPAGALLAVPLTMVAKIMLENTDSMQWLAQLMENRPAKKPLSSG